MGTVLNTSPCSMYVKGLWHPNEVLIILVLFQTKLQLETLQSLHYKIQKGFVNEKPPHLLENNTSSFHILTENVWSGMSSTQVQERLKISAVIIKSEAVPPFTFDRELLADMLGHGDMQYVVPMEGEILYQLRPSISERLPTYSDQSLEGDRRVIPVAMQSLLSSHMEEDGGKSLFAHYFPGDSPHRLESTASSSRIAWQATKGHQLCKDLFTHQGWASWCGAATKGALVKLPMDPDGLCIHMRLRSGKLYAILEDNSPLTRRYEGLVLGPNSRLYEKIISSLNTPLIDSMVPQVIQSTIHCNPSQHDLSSLGGRCILLPRRYS